MECDDDEAEEMLEAGVWQGGQEAGLLGKRLFGCPLPAELKGHPC